MKWLALFLAVLAAPALAQDIRPQARVAAEVIRPQARVAVVPAQPEAPQITREVVSTKTRPVLRPARLAPRAQVAVIDRIRPKIRPLERPELALGARTLPEFRAERGLFAFSPTAPAFSLRPTVRPAAITQRAVERQLAIRRGQVCGDPAIQGQAIGAIPGNGACGVDNAVRVRSVAGVTLHPQPTIDCRTASALKAWVAQGAKPAVGQIGGGISSLRVVSHYACRNRNNGSGGRLSEHAFGRAIDIAGIGLRSGQELTVLTDWGQGQRGQALRQMWRAACGPFGTVLGPEANRFHRDHFHFDTARYRSGSYCR